MERGINSEHQGKQEETAGSRKLGRSMIKSNDKWKLRLWEGVCGQIDVNSWVLHRFWKLSLYCKLLKYNKLPYSLHWWISTLIIAVMWCGWV